MHAKLGFVALLVAYHMYCAKLRKQLAAGECKWGPKQLRALNEGPTLLLVTIVLLVIFQNSFPTSATTWLIAGLVLSFLITIQLYAKKRRLDKERELAEGSVMEGSVMEGSVMEGSVMESAVGDAAGEQMLPNS